MNEFNQPIRTSADGTREAHYDLRNEEENDKALDAMNDAHREAIKDMSNLDKIKEAPPELVVDEICKALRMDCDATVEDMLNNDFNKGEYFHERFYQCTIDLHEFDYTEIDNHLFEEGEK